jgi:hypothetical protein
VPSTHNINSDSQSKVATSVSIVKRRGEQNVPKRYLKDAEGYTDKYLGNGYYVADPDKDDTFCAVDFSFDTLQWGLTELWKASFELPVLSQLNTDSESSTKKDKTTVIGDQLTEVITTKNPLPKPSSSAVTMETPQTQTQISPSQQTKQKNEHLQHWLNSFPHTLPNPSSIPSTDYLCWLLECHKSHQLPPSLQRAHWAELLELEYPPEQEVAQLTYSGTSLAEEEDLEENRLTVEDLLMVETHPIQQTQELEEGEIPQTLEEGEILPMEDSLTNY